AVIVPSNFFQSIPLSLLPRRLPLQISMGEGAMKVKVKRPSWERRNLWESNTFGYFGHTASDPQRVKTPRQVPRRERTTPGCGPQSSRAHVGFRGLTHPVQDLST